MKEITKELVEQLIEEQFYKWKDLPIKPIENMGHDNRTFYLGDTMTVRLPSGKDYASQAKKEQRWLPYLKDNLSLPLPTIVGIGTPTKLYPYDWSICSWIEGETANKNNIKDSNQFAIDVGKFIVEFESIDCTNGPIAGKHNFYRGGDLSTYDAETRELITIFKDHFDSKRLIDLWQAASQSKWQNPPVWVHGDLVPTNLLVNNGKLSAIIDFGILGVGDPACDLAIAWTFFKDESRQLFIKELSFDKDTWIRSLGWVLWKSLLIFRENSYSDYNKAKEAKDIIEDILFEYTKL